LNIFSLKQYKTYFRVFFLAKAEEMSEEILKKIKEKRCPAGFGFDEKDVYIIKLPKDNPTCIEEYEKVLSNLGPHHKKLVKKHVKLI
jgi:hypothetical protein